jgi:general secretion pathway protein K
MRGCARTSIRLVSSHRGIALPLVLWVLTLMSVVALSFTFLTRTEARSTFNFREATEKRLLAEAGIERGVMEIAYRTLFASQSQGPNAPELKMWRTDGTVYREALGAGYYSVRIMDDSGKIAINGLTDANSIVLRNLLLHQSVAPEVVDTIVDSILDWKDADELHRLSGAESDYYMSLPNPYKAKNANFDTVEELLLVKGMTPEILFGDGERKGIVRFITVYTQQGGVSLSCASREVLLSIPGMTEAAVERLLAYRESVPVPRQGDMQALIGDIYPAVSPYVSAGEQNVFTITSVGQKQDEKKGYAITATIIPGQGGAYRTLYYKTPSETEQ